MINHPWLVIVAIGLLAGAIFFQAQEKQGMLFVRWLQEHAQEIQSGGCLYQGQLITSSTILAQYEVVLSFVVVTVRKRSTFHVVGSNQAPMACAMYTLYTLLFGWWGIPHGPLWTIPTLVRNLRGGIRRTVADLLRQ